MEYIWKELDKKLALEETEATEPDSRMGEEENDDWKEEPKVFTDKREKKKTYKQETEKPVTQKKAGDEEIVDLDLHE